MGALPALLGGLAKESSDSGGATSLAAALDRDHDGSILDDLAGYIGQGGREDGPGILGHVFGDRQPSVETALSQFSGLDLSLVSKILGMLAPLVMGALGLAQSRQGLGPSGLSSLLGDEKKNVSAAAPQTMDLVTQLLDSDKDGSVVDDLASMGADLLGFLGGKR
jgi:hypothetical protein